jgi:hypothetical protein
MMERWPQFVLNVDAGRDRAALSRPESVFYIGLDLGQARDPSTVAVLERADVRGEWDAALWGYLLKREFRLRYLERIPLGTSYPGVVERVRQVVNSPQMVGRRHLAVDATGVGRPVVDLLKRAGLGCEISAVTITGGDMERRVDGYYRTPKRDLIVGLQVMLQTGELQIATGVPEGAALVRELSEMRVSVEEGGREGWRSGKHDDLVFAVALASWAARAGRR